MESIWIIGGIVVVVTLVIGWLIWKCLEVIDARDDYRRRLAVSLNANRDNKEIIVKRDAEIVENNKQLSDTYANLDEWKACANGRLDRLEKAREDRDDLKRQLDDCKAIKGKLAGRVSIAEKDRDGLLKRVDGLETGRALLEKDVKLAKSVAEDKQKVIDTKHEVIERMREEIKGLEKINEETEGEHNKLFDEYKKLEAKVEKMAKEKHAQGSRIGGLRKSDNWQRRRIAFLEQQLKETGKELTKTQKILESLKKDIVKPTQKKEG